MKPLPPYFGIAGLMNFVGHVRFRGKRSGFREIGSGFRVVGLGLRAWGFGFRFFF